MKTKHFRDLHVWQRSMKLARDVYVATGALPKQEMFGLTSQMRRAAVSVPSNVAEGYGRISDRSFRVFLAQARGSLFELETQLQLAADVGYLDLATTDKLLQECQEIARMLNALLNTLKEQEKSASGTKAPLTAL